MPICGVCEGHYYSVGPTDEWGHNSTKCKDDTLARLRSALREIADGYTTEMYDRPLAFKMSRIAKKALSG